MLDVVDNFLSPNNHEFVMQYCVDASYFYGETDNEDTPVTGMVHNVWIKDFSDELKDDVATIGASDENRLHMKKFFDLLTSSIEERYEKCTKDHLTRLYVNCFSPNDNPYFHTDVGEDQDGITFLYYPHFDYDVDNGGETQFQIDGYLYGIQPYPNRLVCFPANILHKATSYRDHHRFTVAVKYEFE